MANFTNDNIVGALTFSSFMLKVQISKAERDVYAAIIDEQIAMKIGPGHFEPPGGSHKWSLAVEGRGYKIWEASSEYNNH